MSVLAVRGAGEGGITAAGATLASAVRDALGGSQDVSALPLTPGRVRAMAEAAPRTARTLATNADGLTCGLFR